MPTGYTYAVENGEDTFEMYVWRCARAMGACVLMRNEPLNTLPPDKFETRSEYYLQRKKEAEEELAFLEAMSEEEIAQAAEKHFRKMLASYKDYEARKRSELANYMDMKKQVEAWTPPSPDHEGLKDFMLQQIEVSTRGMHREGTPPERMTPEDWYREELKHTKSAVSRNNMYDAEDIERTAARTARNLWLAQLAESVPKPDRLP